MNTELLPTIAMLDAMTNAFRNYLDADPSNTERGALMAVYRAVRAHSPPVAAAEAGREALEPPQMTDVVKACQVLAVYHQMMVKHLEENPSAELATDTGIAMHKDAVNLMRYFEAKELALEQWSEWFRRTGDGSMAGLTDEQYMQAIVKWIKDGHALEQSVAPERN